VVEGANDIEFLSRLSARLHAEVSEVPDLVGWQEQGLVSFVPVGGGDPASWPNRFRALGLAEFHLYDREQEPESAVRRQAIDRVNRRPDCRGALTAKRSMENYLSPQAIAAAGGGQLIVGRNDSVAILQARHWHRCLPGAAPWDELPRRSQKRFTARAKRWLNTVAVEYMTADLLAEQDPAGEMLGWFAAIRQLVEASGVCGAQSDCSLMCP
jgi:hypothetical protein